MTHDHIFATELDGDTLIVTPRVDLRELEFDVIESGAESIIAKLKDGHAKHLVMDFSETDYYGSTALSFFVKLWKRVKSSGGKMAFCNVSVHEAEILEITNLDTLWPICGARDDAVAAVRG